MQLDNEIRRLRPNIAMTKPVYLTLSEYMQGLGHLVEHTADQDSVAGLQPIIGIEHNSRGILIVLNGRQSGSQASRRMGWQ